MATLKQRTVKPICKDTLQLKIDKVQNKINYRDKMIKFYEKQEYYEKCQLLLDQKNDLVKEKKKLVVKFETTNQ
jgi:hypothetical protein